MEVNVQFVAIKPSLSYQPLDTRPWGSVTFYYIHAIAVVFARSLDWRFSSVTFQGGAANLCALSNKKVIANQ